MIVPNNIVNNYGVFSFFDIQHFSLTTFPEGKILQHPNFPFQLTRGSCNSLVGATSNLMERCNSWVELRELDPSRRYNELGEEENEFERKI